MSREDVKNFYELINSNDNIGKEIINIEEEIQQKNNKNLNYEYVISQKIIPIAKKNHLNFTTKEFVDYTNEKLATINDIDLLNVSGGANFANKAMAGLFSIMSFATPLAGGLSQSSYAEDPPRVDVETQTEQMDENPNQMQNKDAQIAQLQQENEELKQQIEKMQSEIKNSKHVRFGYRIDDEQQLLAQSAHYSKKVQILEEKLNEANSKIQELEDEAIDIKSYVNSVKNFAISLNYQANRLVQFLNKVQFYTLDDVEEEDRALLREDIIHVARQIKRNPDGELYLQGKFRRYSAKDANLDQEDLRLILDFYNDLKR